MESFKASLYREKFIIKDAVEAEASEVLELKNNRISFTLNNGKENETVVVRGKIAHSVLIVASGLIKDFYEDGPFLKRDIPVMWRIFTDNAHSEYDAKYNDDIWLSIYINGKSTFKDKEPPLAEIVEKCAAVTSGSYDATANTLANMIKKARNVEKVVVFSFEPYVDISIEGDNIICGIENRSQSQTLKFNLQIEDGEFGKCLGHAVLLCSAYLEMFDIDVFINNSGITNMSKERVLRLKEATIRRSKILEFIKEAESEYKISYIS